MGKEIPCLALGVCNWFLVGLNQANGHFSISFCYNEGGEEHQYFSENKILQSVSQCSHAKQLFRPTGYHSEFEM